MCERVADAVAVCANSWAAEARSVGILSQWTIGRANVMDMCSWIRSRNGDVDLALNTIAQSLCCSNTIRASVCFFSSAAISRYFVFLYLFCLSADRHSTDSFIWPILRTTKIQFGSRTHTHKRCVPLNGPAVRDVITYHTFYSEKNKTKNNFKDSKISILDGHKRA